MKKAENVQAYIAAYPKEVQKLLKEIRSVIRKTVPEAEEAIKYGMPTYVLNKTNLVSFGAYKNHIGFYPVPRADEKFRKALEKFEGEKATARFPLDQPIPANLISRIVKYNVKRSLEKQKK